MLFVEGKWFYNYVLSMHNDTNVQLRSINTTDIKSVNHFTKDNKLVTSELEYLSAA